LVKQSSIPNAGQGLFALKEFKKGAFLADYTGEVLTKNQLDQRYGPTEQDLAPYGFQVSKNKFIDSACERGITAYANSSPGHNNAAFSVSHGRVRLKATENINVGSEVFVDYGDDYFAGPAIVHSTKKKKL
jgi:SET domain-containing protein